MGNPICICGSEKFDIVIEGDYSYFTLNGKAVPFQALKCLKCGIVITNPAPIAVGYNNEMANELEIHEDGYSVSIEELFYRIRRLKPYLNESTKILEIGCYTGKLVEMAAQLGVKESIGIEILSKAAAYGNSLGRDIRNMYLHECNFPSNYFDVIQAHHVLEHIPNLPETLDEIWRVLKPNGIFYVTVPRYNSVFVRSANWAGWYPQEHFWHFTQKTLIELLGQHGFKISKFSCPVHYDTRKDYLYPVKKLLKWGVKKLNMGDTVEAVFSKKIVD